MTPTPSGSDHRPQSRAVASKKPRERGQRGPATRANEPRTYDRKFYARALLVSVIVIALAVGFAVYGFRFKTTTYRRPYFDLSSLYMRRGFLLPDASNPCIVLQKQLEATRKKDYRKAYDLLSGSLRGVMSLDDMINNAKSNSLLFRGVSSYVCDECRGQGDSATVVGSIEYDTGGNSRVEASMVREGGAWRISQMTLIFQ